MKLFCKLLIWSIPLLLILVGICLRQSNTTSFLGLVSWGVAAIFICYRLLWHFYAWKPSHIICVVLTAILSVGIGIAAITGVLIVMSTSGKPDSDIRYVVVLGAKVNDTEPSRTLAERIDAAAVYLNANPDTIAVVSGGQGTDEGISEAQCMFNELTKRGINADRIWIEDRATSTWENLSFSLDLIEEKTGTRPEKIGLISNEFHLYRATLFAEKCGTDAYGIPAKTGSPVYFLNYFLREIAGVWHYIIFGG